MVSKNLPAVKERPRELHAFMIPSIVKNSERYIAQSLPGHDFFRKGVHAEAVLDGDKMQAFVITEDSKKKAGKVFQTYISYFSRASPG